MSEPHVTFDEATNTYLTIVCSGSECPCSCEPSPEPPEPCENCDMECLDVTFTPDYSEDIEVIEGIATATCTRTLTPGNAGELCDQDTLTGTVEIEVTAVPPFQVNWEIFSSTDSDSPDGVWTLVSKTHSNGDSGSLGNGGTLTVTFVWRYNADEVDYPADFLIPAENCCIPHPDIGVALGGGEYEYYLSAGTGETSAAMALCGIPCE